VLFPNPGVDKWFPLVLVAATGEREITRCTGRSGDVLTIVRAQEGTAARPFSPGARVNLRVTKAVFDELDADLAAEVGDLEDALAAAVADLEGKLSAPTGTRMQFQQSTAPAGWVKESDAAFNDATVVSTTGSVATAGSVGAGTLYARTGTDAVTLVQANLPSINLLHSLSAASHQHTAGSYSAASHAHSGTTNIDGSHTHNGGGNSAVQGVTSGGTGAMDNGTQATGTSGSAHAHLFTTDPSGALAVSGVSSLSGALGVSGTVSLGGSNSAFTPAIDMRVKRYSVIVAQKS
jgi:hypothetical protein